MPCKDCFNGCVETTSDRCIKYTGGNIPELNIETGDTMSKVNSDIIQNLLKTMDGTGVLLDIDPKDFCEYIQPFFNTCENITLVNYIQVLMTVICDLRSKVEANSQAIENLTPNS